MKASRICDYEEHTGGRVGRRWIDGRQHDFLGEEGLADLNGLVEPLGEPGAFELRLKAVRAGALVLTYLAATSCRLTGLAAFPSRRRCVHLVLPFDGHLQLEGFGKAAVPAGGMLAYREAQPPAVRVQEPGRALVVSMTAGAGPGDAALSVDAPYLLSGASTRTAAVRAVAEVVFKSDERDAGAAELLVSLCAGVLVDASITASMGDRDGRLASEAMRLIVSDFRCRDFTAQRLAERVGVSVRALQRAFAPRGGLSRVIRSYRTQEAIRLLGSPDMREATLDMVARMSGFLDARAMRKAIMAATGMLPRDYRRNFD